ncbi:MAG TPA: aminotransferase class I/II-fold pyridoxal phosphate-dependent enzyme [Nitrososphaerales archaeon]|nr:aminotransferase class I/II-fold pyridoxal phosphate-dependent enzyme [Nitrososphaerales archaeon]
MKFATKAIHVGEEPGLASESGDVVVPIHLSTTFARREVKKPRGGYEYSRTANPTRDALELRLAALEESKHALAFASGLAAEATLVLSLLKKGDHVVAFDDLYGGTRRLFSQTLSNFGLDFTYVDAREARNVDRAISKRTKMIWLESPTNPLLKICDIKAISEVASRHQIITVVDNTFMSPYFQNPLQLGADVVLHSATKYLGGHSDVLGGAIMTSNEEIYTKAKFNQNAIGAVPSPFDCFLLLRGMKTLAVRMERHQLNAMRVAEHLEAHPAVVKVVYPGLKSHPQYALGKRQMSGSGGVLSFEVRGTLRDVRRFLQRVKVFSLAESLGGVESLIEHPASMTHASVPEKAREGIGITDRLVRASVGIEDVSDLIEDLDGALG